jgi:hypothetical protein
MKNWYIEEYTSVFFFLTVPATDLLTLSLLLPLKLAGHNRQWIDTDTINQYYRSCWLLIVLIHR